MQSKKIFKWLFLYFQVKKWVKKQALFALDKIFHGALNIYIK